LVTSMPRTPEVLAHSASSFFEFEPVHVLHGFGSVLAHDVAHGEAPGDGWAAVDTLGPVHTGGYFPDGV
jgi:hypothetical protein